MDGIMIWFNNNLQEFLTAFERNLIREDRWLQVLKGLGVTLEITVGAIILGSIIGIILCLMRISKSRFLQKSAYMYIDIFRGTPLVTQLLIFYFGILNTPGYSKLFVAILVFGLNSGAYMAEIFRSGILAVDGGQMEAGRSLGLTYWKTMTYIVLPQGFKNCLPAIANEFIVLVKETAIVGYITLKDLTKVSDVIRSRTYSQLFPLIVAAVIYYCVTKLLSILFTKLEGRMRLSDKR